MILRVLAVSMIGFTLAGCVSSSGLSGDVYSASEAKQVQSVTYGTIVHTRAVQIQSGDDSNAIGAIGGAAAVQAGADFLCYLTPAEHLTLPDVNDVRAGVLASRIAAQAGETALGKPQAACRLGGQAAAVTPGQLL